MKIKFAKFAITVLMVLSLANRSFAQYQEREEKPFIEVTGMAEQEVVPDEIFVRIIIRERYVKGDKVTIESQEEKLKNYLREIGVDLKDLYLENANADWVKIKRRTEDVLTQKDYVLKVASAKTVGQVFQQLEKMEITDAYILKVSHTKILELKKEVRMTAIKAAKAKAEYLLTAIGEQCGKPLIIREHDYNSGPVYLNARAGGMMEKDYSNVQGEPSMEFKKIKIEAQIYVKFAIK